MTSSFLAPFDNSSIQALLTSGHIVPTLDAYGNLNLLTNSTEPSSSIISFPLEKLIYDNNYIQTYYDKTFTEFTAVSIPVINQITASNANTVAFQEQINTLQAQLAQVTSSFNSLQQQNMQLGALQAEQSASKALAIGLRIQLGQGTNYSDFSSVYPWLPLSSSNTP